MEAILKHHWRRKNWAALLVGVALVASAAVVVGAGIVSGTLTAAGLSVSGVPADAQV